MERQIPKLSDIYEKSTALSICGRLTRPQATLLLILSVAYAIFMPHSISQAWR